MKKKILDNIKLGVFVFAGLAFLILLLYMIGRNKNLFGSTYTLKAHFTNVQGLVAGNNVRYAGIEVGTVKKIYILNDTLVEVEMVLDEEMNQVIRKNAVASIGSDGLMGNKVVNIAAGNGSAPFAQQGDVLASRQPIDMDEMLRTLEKTNTDVGAIAANLKNISSRLSTSNGLMTLLDDQLLPAHLKTAASNIQVATARAAEMTKELETIVSNVKDGKGSLGMLLNDTSFARSLNDAMAKIEMASAQAEALTNNLHSTVADIEHEIKNGRGTVNALLKDSNIVLKLNSSLQNIEKGTAAFNENMEALKHNFLFRGYFRKLERQKQKTY